MIDDAVYGIDVDMLVNPNLVFGRSLWVISSLGPAYGTWPQLSHQIESLTPGRLTCPMTCAIGCCSWNARLRLEPQRRQRE
jgi:hypothetical protein